MLQKNYIANFFSNFLSQYVIKNRNKYVITIVYSDTPKTRQTPQPTTEPLEIAKFLILG